MKNKYRQKSLQQMILAKGLQVEFLSIKKSRIIGDFANFTIDSDNVFITINKNFKRVKYWQSKSKFYKCSLWWLR